MLSYLFILSREVCHYYINAKPGVPNFFEFSIERGQYLCVNSTYPWMTAIINASVPVEMRAFKSESYFLPKEQIGNQNYSSTFLGIDFGRLIGQIEATSRQNARFHISVWVPPKECGFLRYISHSSFDKFDISRHFENKDFIRNNKTLCIFVPEIGSYAVQISKHIYPSNIGVQLCQESSCAYISDNSPHSVESPAFFKLQSLGGQSFIFSMRISDENFVSTHRLSKALYGTEEAFLQYSKPSSSTFQSYRIPLLILLSFYCTVLVVLSITLTIFGKVIKARVHAAEESMPLMPSRAPIAEFPPAPSDDEETIMAIPPARFQ